MKISRRIPRWTIALLAGSAPCWTAPPAAAEVCRARLVALAGEHFAPTEYLVSGESNAPGAVVAVIQGADGRVLQQIELYSVPVAGEEGDAWMITPRYRSFAAIARFPVEFDAKFRVSFIDFRRQVVCVTLIGSSRPLSVLESLGVDRGILAEMANDAGTDVDVVSDEVLAAGDEAIVAGDAALAAPDRRPRRASQRGE